MAVMSRIAEKVSHLEEELQFHELKDGEQLLNAAIKEKGVALELRR